MLQVKYAGKPFAKMNEQERDAHCVALLMKINVVTGWPLPEREEEENILSEQLKLYIIENWPLFNPDEIMYAVRSYGTTLNNWGKNMNLSLIGKALIDYENERVEVSKLEESKKPMQTNLIAPQADWKGLCETYYQDFLNNKLNFEIMPYQLYDEFVKQKLMSDDAYEDYLEDATQKLMNTYQNYLYLSDNDREKREWSDRITALKIGEHEEKVIQMAKKFSVQLLFRVASRGKIKNLFIKTTK